MSWSSLILSILSLSTCSKAILIALVEEASDNAKLKIYYCHYDTGVGPVVIEVDLYEYERQGNSDFYFIIQFINYIVGTYPKIYQRLMYFCYPEAPHHIAGWLMKQLDIVEIKYLEDLSFDIPNEKKKSLYRLAAKAFENGLANVIQSNTSIAYFHAANNIEGAYLAVTHKKAIYKHTTSLRLFTNHIHVDFIKIYHPNSNLGLKLCKNSLPRLGGKVIYCFLYCGSLFDGYTKESRYFINMKEVYNPALNLQYARQCLDFLLSDSIILDYSFPTKTDFLYYDVIVGQAPLKINQQGVLLLFERCQVLLNILLDPSRKNTPPDVTNARNCFHNLVAFEILRGMQRNDSHEIQLVNSEPTSWYFGYVVSVYSDIWNKDERPKFEVIAAVPGIFPPVVFTFLILTVVYVFLRYKSHEEYGKYA